MSMCNRTVKYSATNKKKNALIIVLVKTMVGLCATNVTIYPILCLLLGHVVTKGQLKYFSQSNVGANV